MSTILWSNNATSTLAGAITNTALTANLASGAGALFPAPTAGNYFVATFIDSATGLLKEIVHVTNVTGDTVTMVRAQEGTTALAWSAGDIFANLVTAGTLAAFAQAANLGAVTSFNTRTGAVVLSGSDVTTALTYTPLSNASNAVANANLAQMPTNTFKANNTGGTANAADITVTAALALLGFDFTGIGTGEVKLGPMLVKWGIAGPFPIDTDEAISFANAFPTNCLQVMLTPQLNGAYGASSDSWVVLKDSSITTAGFHIYVAASANSQQLYCRWLAIGD